MGADYTQEHIIYGKIQQLIEKENVGCHCAGN